LRSGFGQVMVSPVAPALTLTALAASLLIGLAAVVRMAGPAADGFENLTGVIRLPQGVTGTIVTLFTLAAVVFVVDLARRARRRRREDGEGALGPEPVRVPPWLRAVTQVLSLLYFVVLGYVLWQRGIPFMAMMLGHGARAVDAVAQEVPVAAPPLVTWTFGVLAIVTGLGALAFALWVAFGDRLADWLGNASGDDAPRAPLAAAVEDSLEDLRAERDPRRAIIRCYARFERAAADSGLARSPWLTPMEFMRVALERLPLPRAAVPTLTGLFELARFSHRPLGPAERDRALEALDEIKAAIETANETGRRDAVAR
jgi:Domain of unknown function (DUF4129)